jgi:SAM-dependent methyltransferase
MATARVVEPEWLDELPVEDPRAMRSRRDLRLVNRLMSNESIVAGELSRRLGDTRPRIVELGAGDGTFALRIARRLRASAVTLLDRAPVVSDETLAAFGAARAPATVVRGDALDWMRAQGERQDAIFVNLFLHHLRGEALAELLSLVARCTKVFVGCEPRRSTLALTGSRMLGLIGCNDVTRHDAVVSVRAGFNDAEITALWPEPAAWDIEERGRGLFSHSFVAARK